MSFPNGSFEVWDGVGELPQRPSLAALVAPTHTPYEPQVMVDHEDFDHGLRWHQFTALRPGPRLLVLGAVHGDEVCGTQAIERLVPELDRGALALERGRLTLVPVTNPLAYRHGRRAGHRNLNRNLSPTPEPVDFEDHVANVLCPLLADHDVVLDLHSFRGPGEPFALMGPENNRGALEPFGHAERESRLVVHLGTRRIVEGWMEVYARGVRRRQAANPDASALLTDVAYGVGTTEYMRIQGGYGVTLECGQHEDPQAPDRAYRAIQQTLAVLGLVERAPEPPPDAIEVLRLVDVTDRDSPDDAFARPWHSFDPVTAGTPLAHRADGTVLAAPTDGFVVFPNAAAAVGHEWFYFAERSSRRLDP